MRRQYDLEVKADPAEVRRARVRTSRQLERWGLHELVDVAGLLVTEIVGNAVLHTGAPARLRLVSDGQLHVEVFDRSPHLPALREADPEEPGGWGLELVDALASEWGWTPQEDGKSVWCLLPVPTTAS